MQYTDTVRYIEPTPLTYGEVIAIDRRMRVNNPVIDRHEKVFNHKFYKQAAAPSEVFSFDFDVNNFDVNVLRMMIKDKRSSQLFIPKELMPIKDLIEGCVLNYDSTLFNIYGDFVYITVRTVTDDNYYKLSGSWHVDGFQGTRVTRHTPEINYLWANDYPTEFLLESFDVEDFDYSKYNINSYFRDYAQSNNIYMCKPKHVYMMDPYMIHRAPDCDFHKKRVIVRVNVSPVEIEDPTNTINPMLKKLYPERNDIRNTLEDYKGPRLGK